MGNEKLGLIAGKGRYPLLLAESARKQGVQHIFAVAFKGETDRSIQHLVDEVRWIYVGQMDAFLEAFQKSGVTRAVMAGQITPRNLFHVRMDKTMIKILSRLKERNADTIFKAIGDALAELGITLKPASLYMESCMPQAGVLTKRAPDDREKSDIQFGLKIARAINALQIGQTVVVKKGTVLAVEAFEGTDDAIRRAGKSGGKGTVVVKIAGEQHDMRFDIPVIGQRTLKKMRKAGANTLAVQAKKTILLDQKAVCDLADSLGICIEAVDL